ncbi:hypothetical protein HDU89_004651 [Geranomyces variabilis]|nr:hypothetical protein HDU89_004651 [Geranomyces variabilis]
MLTMLTATAPPFQGPSPLPLPADEAPDFPSSLSLIPPCNSRGSSNNQHPLLSLQLDPSLSILPSELSSYSTILPSTDLLAALDPPPEGDYRPLFSPDATSRSSTTTRRGGAGGGRGGDAGDDYSVCSSAGPNPSECAHADAEENNPGDNDGDEDGLEAAEAAYASLIRRVEEVLAYNEHGQEDADEEEYEQGEEEEDAETSLLRKVQEVLQSGDAHAPPLVDVDEVGPRRGRSPLMYDQQLDCRRAESSLVDEEKDLYAKPPAVTAHREQHHYHHATARSATVTAIDFSLADGTYADVLMTKTQKNPRGRTPPLASSGSLSPGGYDRQWAHAESAGREPRYPSASPPPPPPATTRVRVAHARAYDDPAANAEYAVGRMARADSDGSIHVPNIDYQSMVSEDTIIERQVSSLMAKYGVIDPNASQYHEPVSTHHTSSPPQPRPPPVPLPSPHTKVATPLIPWPTAASFASVSTSSYSSASFADQLSVASLEYMARHALITPRRKGQQQQQRYPSPMARRLVPAAEQGVAAGSGGGVLRARMDEPMSEILDVERIRRLPKLGAVRASGLAGVRR